MSSKHQTEVFPRRFSPELRAFIESDICTQFEQIAERFPDAAAVYINDQTITYAELDRAANGIAHAIHEQEVPLDCPVALALGFEISTVVAMLGCLKAGVMYAPLDLANPADRLMHILARSDAALILTDSAHSDQAAALAGGSDRLSVVTIDRLGSRPDSPARTVSADTYAGLYFTSGSTGVPNGIVRSHRNVLATVAQAMVRFDISAGQTLACTFSNAFRASTTTIFGALLTGGRLCVYNFNERGISDFADWLEETQASVLHMIVTPFRAFTETLVDRLDLPHLRAVMLAGEALTASEVSAFFEYFPRETMLVNRLASTEAGQITEYIFDRQTFDPGKPVPVGHPVEDTSVVLIDDDGQLAADGEAGEIAVSGDLVSPGYWKDPDRNAERYVAIPAAGPKPFYLTRDLGRWLPDGTLGHLGRKDLDVKIRGYRINVHEVEDRLRRHPDVAEAAVWVHAGHDGQPRLVGYFVPVAGGSVVASDLRDWLEDAVADYMIPSFFIEQTELPVTVTGKVDRKALPAPNFDRPALDTEFVGPVDGLEQELQDIWENVLGIKPVGVYDDFFDLGGHSLLALQLVESIQLGLGLDLSPHVLLEAGNIREMAERIRNHDDYLTATDRLVILLREGESKPPVFLIHPRGGHVMVFRNLARYLDSERPIYAIQARGLHDGLAPLNRVEDMARLYISEIKAIQPEGPYYIGGQSFGGLVAFEMACQLTDSKDKVGLVFLFDTRLRDPQKRSGRRRPELKNQPVEPKAAPARMSLRERISKAVKQDRQALRQMSMRQRSAYLASRLKHMWNWYIVRTVYRVRGQQTEFDQSLWSATRRLKTAHAEATRRYRPQRPIDCPSLYIQVEMSKPRSTTDIWANYLGGPAEFIVSGRTHRSLLEEPDVRHLAAEINKRLARL